MSDQSTQNSMKEALIAIRKGDRKLSRDHDPWTDDELEMLADRYYRGEDISAIAITLERSESAVFNRLRIGGIMKEVNGKSLGCSNVDKCKCHKCETRFNCTKNKEFSSETAHDFMIDYR